MKHTRFLICGLLALAMLGILDGAAQAQEARWGVGAFAHYSVPLLKLRDRWDNSSKFGGAISYAPSNATTIEIEYHYSKFDNGKVEDLTFEYGPTGETLGHPNAKSTLTYNSMVVSGLLFVGDENSTRGFKANDFRYFALVGGGFYRYKAVNEGLIYAQQSTSPIDATLVMDPQIDKRFAYGLNMGAGVEAFVTPNMAVDLRARVNVVIGELRPMEYYDLEKVRPLITFDLGAGMKFYFWR
jgi:opacity protein-like surface antigen